MPAPAIRRGYSDTLYGQLHWRRNFVERIDIVLLHWAPASGRMYEAVLTALAAREIGAVAFDLPGFGQSLRPPEYWGPAMMAACLSAGTRALTPHSVAVAGGHLAANIAIEWSLAAPEQVSHVLLDGVYAPTPEEAAALFAPYAGLSPRLRKDDSHERFIWRATCAFLHEWNPQFTPTAQTMPAIYDAMADYLQMGYDSIRDWLEPGDAAQVPYDALARVAHIRSPLLVLTAEFDALRPAYARVIKANPRARGHEFPGLHPLQDVGRASEYAKVLADFHRAAGMTAASH